jgi:hypothetical protein
VAADEALARAVAMGERLQGQIDNQKEVINRLQRQVEFLLDQLDDVGRAEYTARIESGYFG